MISRSEYSKKQILIVFLNQGEKLSFLNDNIVVRDCENQVKHQSTCYRVAALFVVGNFTITTGLLSRAKKFGFPIFLMSAAMRTIDVLGHSTEGNTLLREAQYERSSLEIAKMLVKNKIMSQRLSLVKQRDEMSATNEAIALLKKYEKDVDLVAKNIHELMGIEGAAARVYFPSKFSNYEWEARRPRVKNDFVNSTLDLGYTILFNFIESNLRMYGFDLYKGNLHTDFYKRKSLVCDLVEPFRPIIDHRIRTAIGLGKCKSSNFLLYGNQWQLKKENYKRYNHFLTSAVLEHKEAIFDYVRSYYRYCMRPDTAEFPQFVLP